MNYTAIAQTMQLLLLGYLLILASISDLQNREIPDEINILIALTAFLDFRLNNLFGIVPAVLLFFLVLLLDNEQIGCGDIKLIAACGIVLGFEKTIFGICIGLSSMLIFCIFARFYKKMHYTCGGSPIPLAPFLSFGFFTSILI